MKSIQFALNAMVGQRIDEKPDVLLSLIDDLGPEGLEAKEPVERFLETYRGDGRAAGQELFNWVSTWRTHRREEYRRPAPRPRVAKAGPRPARALPKTKESIQAEAAQPSFDWQDRADLK